MKMLHLLLNIAFGITGAIAALGAITILVYELFGYPALVNVLSILGIHVVPEQIWMASAISASMAMVIFLAKNKRRT